ncbi:TauD/TfdA family dioxygenase [Alphaproteobacteria bacterium]|nr:TauD/TfdA family dioxygenase [Alphaproteobacteria bacterium]
MKEFELTPLSDLMGAEISGLDLSQKIDKITKDKLLSAIKKYLVVCIKNQNLNPAELANVSRIFGSPKKYFVQHETVDNIPEVIVVSNRTSDNKPRVYASHWHTDDSYREKPATLTFIYPDILPKNGGGTDFINCYSVFQNLPENLKNKISNLSAIHKWQSRRNVSKVAKLSKEQEKETPEVEHPLIRTHPISGEKSLYINPNRIDHIAGFDDFESDKLLDELYEFSFQSKFQYSHSYQEGDLVIWDNRCTMHKANSDYDLNQLRVMHRVMLEGEKVYS